MIGMLKRILLAEDDPRDVELILQGLRAADLANEVMVVGDGAEALDFLHRRGRFAERAETLPALVLLDIKMPKMNGLEVLREIRASRELAAVPVVIMTSSREETDIDAAYALGCNAFVVKPVSFKAFIETVKAIGQFWAVLNEPPLRCLGR
jgi:CheY-like chemotaxis protein